MDSKRNGEVLVQISVDVGACLVVGIIEIMAKLKEGAQNGYIFD